MLYLLKYKKYAMYKFILLKIRICIIELSTQDRINTMRERLKTGKHLASERMQRLEAISPTAEQDNFDTLISAIKNKNHTMQYSKSEKELTSGMLSPEPTPGGNISKIKELS